MLVNINCPVVWNDMSIGVFFPYPSSFPQTLTVPTACYASPFARGNTTTCHVIKSILSCKVYCLWNAVSTEHLLQCRYDCGRGRYFKSSYINVPRKIVNDKQVVLFLPEEKISADALLWSFSYGVSTTRVHFTSS